MYRFSEFHIFIILFLTLFIACGSQDSAIQSNPAKTFSGQTTPQPALTPLITVNPHYLGNGGKGISIAILAPRATGLTENQGYLPALVQGEFVSNFSGYSAISVLDRLHLDEQYAELLSGYYDDNNEAGLDLGHLTATDYIMNGSIIRTLTGYSLQIRITKTSDKMTMASYSGMCTFAELDNLTGIRKASLELLQKMGVTLTEEAKTELAGAATSNHVNAQTALAQGITAQRGGTVVEALTYYYQAASFDPSLLEATGRVTALSNNIAGNIGQNVRNDIQQRNAWVRVLREAAIFFNENQPFEIIYNPSITQGSIDYVNETVDVFLEVCLFGSAGFKVLTELKQMLDKTGRSKDWGLDGWPFSGEARIFTKNERYNFNATLSNENGSILGRTSGYLVMFFANDLRNFPHYPITSVFQNINANNITDRLTISVTSENRIAVKPIGEQGFNSNITNVDFNQLKKRAFDYIRENDGTITISGYRSILPIVNIPVEIDNLLVRKIGDSAFNPYKTTLLSNINRQQPKQTILIEVSIPRTIEHIGNYAFAANQLTNIIIPNSVISIDENAFNKNKLTNIIIPNSVTSIEYGVFTDNELSSIVIPTNVTTIDQDAFFFNPLTSITISRNVIFTSKMFFPTVTDITRNYFTIQPFITFYNNNGKRSGTYIYSNGIWKMR